LLRLLRYSVAAAIRMRTLPCTSAPTVVLQGGPAPGVSRIRCMPLQVYACAHARADACVLCLSVDVLCLCVHALSMRVCFLRVFFFTNHCALYTPQHQPHHIIHNMHCTALHCDATQRLFLTPSLCSGSGSMSCRARLANSLYEYVYCAKSIDIIFQAGE
jgi:hypothetical protein